MNTELVQLGNAQDRNLQSLNSAPVGMGSAALVCMPFVSCLRPSLQLGILKRAGEQHGHRVDTYNFTLDFAQALGLANYERLCDDRGGLMGDVLFSVAAFGQDAPDPTGEYLLSSPARLDLLSRSGIRSDELEGFLHQRIPDFVNELTRSVCWGKYSIVGFSSTFYQNVASLALARQIKAQYPEVAIVFGGANVEGVMGEEFLRASTCVDYVVDGEGEQAWPQLIVASTDKTLISRVPNLVYRDGEAILRSQLKAAPLDLDTSPIPDYSDYFNRAESLGLLPSAGRREIDLPFEASRGCWWGQKQHLRVLWLKRH